MAAITKTLAPYIAPTVPPSVPPSMSPAVPPSDLKAFTQDVLSDTKAAAEHIVLSNLGSRHKISRRKITITTIEQIEPQESTDARVQNHLQSTTSDLNNEEE